MKNAQAQATELVYILDRSGSMSGLESDTIGGFNSMLAKQKALPSACRVTTVLFDHEITLLHDRIDLQAVRPLTEADYEVRGMTALLDAVGSTVEKIASAQSFVVEGQEPARVLMVIVTDGYENASRRYSAEGVKEMVEAKKKAGWEFVFLGANIDSVETAGAFGIDADRAVDYVGDAAGTELNFEVLADAQAEFLVCGAVPDSAFDRIREDNAARGGR